MPVLALMGYAPRGNRSFVELADEAAVPSVAAMLITDCRTVDSAIGRRPASRDDDPPTHPWTIAAPRPVSSRAAGASPGLALTDAQSAPSRFAAQQPDSFFAIAA